MRSPIEPTEAFFNRRAALPLIYVNQNGRIRENVKVDYAMVRDRTAGGCANPNTRHKLLRHVLDDAGTGPAPFGGW